jgi:hypothetical protein
MLPIMNRPLSGLVVSSIVVAGVLTACRPSDVLSVPPPTGVIGGTTLTNQAGAEGELTGAMDFLFIGINGSQYLIELSGLFTDEYEWSEFKRSAKYAGIDARVSSWTTPSGTLEPGDTPLERILQARSMLLIALGGLQQYEPPSGRSKVGEAYALIGYSELLLAESYCAGVPLSAIVSGGGYVYGQPLTSDSLLGTAEAHFDSALAYSGGSDTVQFLASIGLGRTRLDRGNYAGAATAVASVPTGFAYDMIGYTGTGTGGSPNFYQSQIMSRCGQVNISNLEGGNGYDFASANDPRLIIDSTLANTCDGNRWYYPAKFGDPAMSVPLATGVEARLIQAEAAWQAGNPGTWASDLNALRANAPSTYLAAATPMDSLTTDSTTGASEPMQVDVMFRERAFWLFGLGTRQGDLRRLVRQYGREPGAVWPTGAYANGSNPNLPLPLPAYGTDVTFTLPTAASGTTTSNPNYQGCLSPTGTS